MTIFAIIGQPHVNAEQLPGAIARVFPDAQIPIADKVWLVAGTGTAKDISDKIGITPDGAVGAAVVVEVASYYGRASTNTWAWIKAKWEATANG
jgi:hypothetical protein